MIELYGFGPSRWAKCYWMLKEIGKDFQEHAIQVSKGDHKSPQFLALNPFGKVPAMKDGNVTLFESTAILNYLGEKYPESGLVPKSGTPDRAHYDQWVSFCITELEQPLWRITKHTMVLPEKMRIAQDAALAREEFAQLAKVLDEQIGTRKFIVGNRFTAADITLSYTLGWAQTLELLAPYKNCTRYWKETSARPAFPAHLFKR